MTIHELRELLNKATPAPWRACTWDPMERPHVHKDDPAEHACSPRGDVPRTTVDAALIAALRNEAPGLLDRVEALENVLRGLSWGDDQSDPANPGMLLPAFCWCEFGISDDGVHEEWCMAARALLRDGEGR